MDIDKSYQKVEGHPGLFRDPQTRAIINMNTGTIEKAKARKAKQKQQINQMESVQKDVDKMKDDITDIKNLLQKLADK